MTDERIESSAEKTHIFKTYLNDDSIKVESKNGILTLRGEASSQAQKDLTTEYSQDVEYVKTVRNEMTVSKKKVLPE